MYHEQIVLNAVNFGPSSTGAFTGGVVDLTPWWDGTVWDEVTFYVHVSAINGLPTSGTLTAKFQNVVPFTGGGQQFSSYRAFDLDAAQKGSMISEGEDWGTIIAFNGSAPTTVKRTIRDFGSRINLRLDASTLSGGTSPTFTVTVTMAMKTNTGGSSGLKGSPTGSAVPPVAAYLGLINNSGNLVGTGSTTRAINNGTSDTIQAAGMIGQYNSSAPTVTNGNWYVAQLDGNANLKTTVISDYPSGATPITATSGNVANTSAVATLTGTAGKTTYITGFEITSAGATVGLVVNPAVTGTVSGTLTYAYAAPAGALIMGTPLIIPFPKPIPASAANTAIVVTLPALGTGNTNATVVAHGYQL